MYIKKMFFSYYLQSKYNIINIRKYINKIIIIMNKKIIIIIIINK